MAWAKIIKKKSRKIYKERQNAYKEEDLDIIIRWKGGKNEGGCCEPVPFSTNGHAVVAN
jgi:hypothetical protein